MKFLRPAQAAPIKASPEIAIQLAGCAAPAANPEFLRKSLKSLMKSIEAPGNL